METQNIELNDKESIKLEKNSKGYNWSIRILPIEKLNEIDIQRLEKLNDEMKVRFEQ